MLSFIFRSTRSSPVFNRYSSSVRDWQEEEEGSGKTQIKHHSDVKVAEHTLTLMLDSYLVDVSPVPVILQALPEHSHDLIAGHHIVGQVRDVGHLGAGRSPWVIRCCFSHLQWKHKLVIKTKTCHGIFL